MGLFDMFFWARKADEYAEEYERTRSIESLQAKVVARDNAEMEKTARIILERESKKKEEK